MFGSDRVLALSIGTTKVVLAEFVGTRSGVPELVSYAMGAIDTDVDAENESTAMVVTALRDLIRERAIKPAPLLMTISGQAVFPRYVKLPPATGDKIDQIVRYEAEQNVPFPIDEVVWDYQLIDDPETGEQNVMLVAAKTESVTRMTDCVLAVGLEPEIVDVAPMALYNVVRYNYPDAKGCTMVLDIGAKASNLIFIEGARIFSRSIPVAGNAITQEIMKEFDTSFEDAEALKRQHGFVAFGGVYAGPESEVADRISKVVRNVVTRLHAEVNRSINFYRSQQGGQRPARVLLTGGSAMIPHMDTFFRERLTTEVDYLNPFLNITVGPGMEEAKVAADMPFLAEIGGLALRKSLACPVEINLMPPELVSKKVMRRRQPFFIMAAAGVVCIMLAWLLYFRNMAGMFERQVESVKQETDRIALLDKAIKDQDKGLADAAHKNKSLTDLVAQRTRWVDVFNQIRACMMDGAWIVGLRPVPPAVPYAEVTEIDLDILWFEDQMIKYRGEQPEIEQMRARLVEQPLFAEATKVTRFQISAENPKVREFSIHLVLEGHTAPITAPATARPARGRSG